MQVQECLIFPTSCLWRGSCENYRYDPMFSPSHYKLHSSVAFLTGEQCWLFWFPVPRQAFCGFFQAQSCRFAALSTMSVHVTVLIHFLLILTPSPQSHVPLLIYLTGRSEIWPWKGGSRERGYKNPLCILAHFICVFHIISFHWSVSCSR